MSVTKINLVEQVVGYYRGEQSDIEALSDVLEHSIAFGWITDPATDGVFGYYDGSAWIWGSIGSSFDGEISGHLQLSGIMSELLLADADDWNPTGLADASIIRIDIEAGNPVTITGIEEQADGEVKVLFNIGAERITLSMEDANSAAENRFELATNIEIFPGKAVAIFYDGTTQRWRQMGNEFSLTDIHNIIGGMVSGNTEMGISVTFSSQKLHFDATHTHEVDQRADIFNDSEGDPAPVGTAADGSSTYASRRDHIHGAGSHTHKYHVEFATHLNFATVAAGATSWSAPFLGASASEAGQLVTKAGTAKNLYIRTATAQPGTGALVLMLRVNGADTALTLNVNAGAGAGTYSNTSSTVAIAAGDRVAFRLVNGAGSASAQVAPIAFEIEYITT